MFLFFAACGVGFLSYGFTTVLASFLLCCHATCVLLIINNNRISALSVLAPTEFMIGNALGLTIGSTILSFYIHSVFASVKCNQSASANFQELCESNRGTINSVWFWSGAVCFVNFATALLIAYGRQELAQSTTMYEQVANMTMEQYEQSIRNEAGSAGQAHPGPRPTFVGDYASVPGIREGVVSP